jgi:hypothetical protein
MRKLLHVVPFHCVVIESVFESDAAGGVIFRAATGLDFGSRPVVLAIERGRIQTMPHEKNS